MAESHVDGIADDPEDENLDPRVKVELEKLNAATDGINHLETEFGEAQALFRQMVAEATGMLEYTAKKIGSQNIAKARQYFDGLKQIRKAGYNLHQAAIFYEMAQNHHTSAKKRVADAELKAFSGTSGKLDPALQELLNQATIEMMETTKQKTEGWQRHQQCAKVFHELQRSVAETQKSFQKQIKKAKPYFDLKMTLNKSLEQQKERVEKIQQGISFAKEQYAKTLKKLELISDDIHRTRKMREEDIRLLATQQREDGVGAESGSEEEIPENHSLPKQIPDRKFDLEFRNGDPNASLTRGIEAIIFSDDHDDYSKYYCDSQNNLVFPSLSDKFETMSTSTYQRSESQDTRNSFPIRTSNSYHDLSMSKNISENKSMVRSSSLPNCIMPFEFKQS